MSLCHFCGHENPDDVVTCVRCARPMGSQPSPAATILGVGSTPAMETPTGRVKAAALAAATSGPTATPGRPGSRRAPPPLPKDVGRGPPPRTGTTGEVPAKPTLTPAGPGPRPAGSGPRSAPPARAGSGPRPAPPLGSGPRGAPPSGSGPRAAPPLGSGLRAAPPSSSGPRSAPAVAPPTPPAPAASRPPAADGPGGAVALAPALPLLLESPAALEATTADAAAASAAAPAAPTPDAPADDRTVHDAGLAIAPNPFDAAEAVTVPFNTMPPAGARRPAAMAQSLGERGSRVARTAATAATDAVARGRVVAVSLVEAARYVLRATRENRGRRAEIARRHDTLAADQNHLTEALSRLGRAVRGLDPPDESIQAEILAIRQTEERMAAAERERGDLEERRTDRQRGFAERDERLKAEIARRDEQLVRVAGELSASTAERRRHQDDLRRIEGELKQLSTEIGDKEAQTLKAQDSSLQATLRADVTRLRTRVGALEPERDDAVAKLAAVDEAGGGLQQRVNAERAGLADLQHALEEAGRERRRVLGEIEAEAERRLAEIGVFERDVTRRYLNLGNLANRTRLDDPSLQELYREIDQVSGAISEQLVDIGSLQEEITRSRGEPFTKGLIVLGGAAGLALLVLILLIRLIAR